MQQHTIRVAITNYCVKILRIASFTKILHSTIKCNYRNETTSRSKTRICYNAAVQEEHYCIKALV